jgi:hypothetical protein
MTQYAIGILFLSLAGPAWAEDDWTTTDSTIEATVQTSIAIDWLTTLGPRCAGCYESNPVLGRNPSDLTVSTYMATMMIGHYLIARLLPQPWRRIWQGVVLGVEAVAVTNNLVVGGGMRSRW